jgi:hypothetical protein
VKKPIKIKAKTPPKKTNIAIKTKAKKIPVIKPKLSAKKLIKAKTTKSEV